MNGLIGLGMETFMVDLLARPVLPKHFYERLQILPINLPVLMLKLEWKFFVFMMIMGCRVVFRLIHPYGENI